MKKTAAFLISLCLIMGLLSPASLAAGTEQAASPRGSVAPYTQEYLDYLALSDAEKALRRAPFPVAINNSYNPYRLFALEEPLPDTYDPRKTEASDTYLESVRNQFQTNTCWTFSSSENLSDYFRFIDWDRDANDWKTGDYKDLSFSSRHMEYSMANIPGQPNNGVPFARELDSGGLQYHVSAYFFNGMGPVLESECPFISAVPAPENYATRAELSIEPRYQVLDYSMFDNYGIYDDANLQSDIARLKEFIYNYGSADTGCYYEPEYYNLENDALYYYGDEIIANHAVLAVGWDDNYPRENFSGQDGAGPLPERDGAWIMQNSWGDYGANGGYFYLSYEDVSAYDLYTCVTNAKESLSYDNRYILDPDGIFTGYSVDNAKNQEAAYGANIFNKQHGVEKLSQIVIGTLNAMSYKIYVDTDFEDGEELSIVGSTYCGGGFISEAGYRTIDIEDVTLTGEKFAVIVRCETPGYNYPVPIDGWVLETEYAQPGTSFVSEDGTKDWEDISAGYQLNCCFKAFTTDVTPKAEISFENYRDDAVIMVFDSQGRNIPKNAGGSFSLVPGKDYLYEEILPGEPITASWGAFTFSGSETQTISCGENKITPRLSCESSASPAYGQTLSANDITLTMSWGEGNSINVGLWQLGDYCIESSLTPSTPASPGGAEFTFGQQSITAPITVGKADPALNTQLNAEDYRPGDTIRLDFMAVNPYNDALTDGLPLVTDYTVTAGGKELEVEDNGGGSFHVTHTIPYGTAPGELSFTIVCAGNELYNEASETVIAKVLPAVAPPPLPPVTESEPSEKPAGDISNFTDLTPGAWYGEAISFVLENGLFAGTSDTSFSPNELMTRAMLMTVLSRSAGEASSPTAGGDWYDAGLSWAVENGVSDGTNPNAPISRQDLACMLYRYAGSPESSGVVLSEFKDADKISSYAVEAMGWAVGRGIISGKPGSLLDPLGSASRAEVAMVLMNYLQGEF